MELSTTDGYLQLLQEISDTYLKVGCGRYRRSMPN